MRTLTIKDLILMVGEKVKVRNDYYVNKGDVVVITKITHNHSSNFYKVDTEPLLYSAPLVLNENGHGFGSGQPIFTDYKANENSIENSEHESGAIISCSYCSCINPDLVKNYALNKKFFVCRNCGKEKV
jgi:hypothetical protein